MWIMLLGMVILGFKMYLFLHFMILTIPEVALFLSRLSSQVDTHHSRLAIYFSATLLQKEVLIHNYSQIWLDLIRSHAYL